MRLGCHRSCKRQLLSSSISLDMIDERSCRQGDSSMPQTARWHVQKTWHVADDERSAGTSLCRDAPKLTVSERTAGEQRCRACLEGIDGLRILRTGSASDEGDLAGHSRVDAAGLHGHQLTLQESRHLAAFHVRCSSPRPRAKAKAADAVPMQTARAYNARRAWQLQTSTWAPRGLAQGMYSGHARGATAGRRELLPRSVRLPA